MCLITKAEYRKTNQSNLVEIIFTSLFARAFLHILIVFMPPLIGNKFELGEKKLCSI